MNILPFLIKKKKALNSILPKFKKIVFYVKKTIYYLFCEFFEGSPCFIVQWKCLDFQDKNLEIN